MSMLIAMFAVAAFLLLLMAFPIPTLFGAGMVIATLGFKYKA